MRLSKKALIEINKLENRIKFLEEELQDLNIKYKYCLFDVEATNREKSFYRKLLDERE